MDLTFDIQGKLDTLLDRTARTETNLENLKTNMGERLGELSVRIDKYNNITGRVRDLEHCVLTMQENCKRMQGERAEVVKRRAVPWGAVVASIISGSIVGLITFLVNHL